MASISPGRQWGRILLSLPQNNVLPRCREVGSGEQSPGTAAEQRRQKSRCRSAGACVVGTEERLAMEKKQLGGAIPLRFLATG